jgi:DNA primase
VQEHYRRFFRNRLFDAFRRPKPRPGRRGADQKIGPNIGIRLNTAATFEGRPRGELTSLRRRPQEVLLALLINHPFLLHEVAEDLAALHLAAADLDKLCHEILRLHVLNPDLDDTALKLHLTENGFGRVVQGVLSPQVLTHAAFARAGADADAVRMGWANTRDQLLHAHLNTQIAEAERNLAEDTTNETWTRLHPLLEQKMDDDGAAGGDFG